jgi:hypothetical protein
VNKLKFLFLTLLAGALISGCLKKEFDQPEDTSSYDPGLPAGDSAINIRALLKMRPYTGGSLDTMLITRDLTLTVIVNADDRSGNIYKSIYAQDTSGGIQIYIDAYSLYNRYPVGRKLYVRLKGMYLSYNSGTGTPCISGAINEQAGPLGLNGRAIDQHIIGATTGNEVKDTVVSFDAARNYTANQDITLLCRLVTIADSVQFGDTVHTYASPTDATNRYIWTCGTNMTPGNATPTGMMAVRTDNYAKFHAQKLPFGRGVISGIYTIYKTTPQLILRDTTDVHFYGPRCGPVATGGSTLFSENFNGGSINADISLTGWVNYAEAGGKKWYFSSTNNSTNHYAKISAYGSNKDTVISWLVTPGINLNGKVNPMLSFRSANGFDNGATLKVLASTDFNGSNFATATWTPLNPTLAPSSASGFSAFTPSGNVSLSSFTGTVYIAFRYEGSDPSGSASDKTTTWEIDEVSVTAN